MRKLGEYKKEFVTCEKERGNEDGGKEHQKKLLLSKWNEMNLRELDEGNFLGKIQNKVLHHWIYRNNLFYAFQILGMSGFLH